MEQKHVSCGTVCDRLPTLSVKYPWLVAQNLEAKEDDTNDLIFYAMHDPVSHHYRCRIPELLGKRIRGYFHGWVVLSNHPHDIMWSLWNPVTSRTICLPPLATKDGNFESIKECCLSSQPGEFYSVLMLTRTKTSIIVFCRLHRERRQLRWKEMTYGNQLRRIVGDNGFLHCLTSCNGKVYALSCGDHSDRTVIHIDIVFNDNFEFVLCLSEFTKVPYPFQNACSIMKPFLKGCCKDLFYIKLGFDDTAKKTIGAIYLFKLDKTSMIWEELKDLKDAIFFLDVAHDCSVFYRNAIASELGGYIHILGEIGKVMYSYDVKDKTISLSSMSCFGQSTHLSLWECWLPGDQGFKPTNDIIVRPVRDDGFDFNIPLDVLRMIMEYCVGVEYLNFRATCKHCQLAAPIIQWSNETSRKRLLTYSMNSPWLLVLDKHRGIITFIDPMFGDKYFIKMPKKLTGDLRICCSRGGWLLLFKLSAPEGLFFFNPFTKDIRELRYVPYLDTVYFLEPPTSPNCKVIGLSTSRSSYCIYNMTTRSWTWYSMNMNFSGTTPHSVRSLTMYAKCIFALNQGVLNLVFAKKDRAFYRNTVVVESPRKSSAQYFLAICDQHFRLVVVDDFGEFLEVLELNLSTWEWEKNDSLGRHMIYISDSTCVCMEAKTPEMENKIYFSRLHSKSGKIVFYSLKTRRYHTFNGRNIEHCFGCFFGTKYYVYPSAWIEPSWSS